MWIDTEDGDNNKKNGQKQKKIHITMEFIDDVNIVVSVIPE